MKNLIVWDLETSGFVEDPEARILEIGAVHVKDGEIVDRRSWMINNGIAVPPKITEITTITQEMVDAGLKPQQALREFLIFLNKEEYHLTHNGIRFDIPFLVKQMKISFDFLPKRMFEAMEQELFDFATDTAAIYKGKKLNMVQTDETHKQYADRVLNTKVFGLKYNVGVCCDDLGIDRSQTQQHRALGDVELTYEIYKKLIA